MECQGLGTDIIEIERIQNAIAKRGQRFIDKIFTEKEQLYCQKFARPAAHYAARFAAKEAVLKALGTGLTKDLSWLDIEILNNQDGKPEIYLSSHLKNLFPKARFLLSMSHCHLYATATALLLIFSKT